MHLWAALQSAFLEVLLLRLLLQLLLLQPRLIMLLILRLILPPLQLLRQGGDCGTTDALPHVPL